MTIEHKLQHFEELCIHSAQEAGEKMTADYTAYLESVLRDHEENVRKQAEARIQTETETIQREANKRLAINQIGLKRTYSQKQEELQGRIFSELRDRLARFMETPAYETLLKEQIRKARDFAQGEGRGDPYLYRSCGPGKAEPLIHGNRLRHPCEPVSLLRRHPGCDRLKKHPYRQFF